MSTHTRSALKQQRKRNKRVRWIALLRPVAGLNLKPNARLLLGALFLAAPFTDDGEQRKAGFQQLCKASGLPESSAYNALEALKKRGFVDYYGRDAYALSPQGTELFAPGRGGYHRIPRGLVKRLGRGAAATLDTLFSLGQMQFEQPWKKRRIQISLRQLAQKLGRDVDTIGRHLRNAIEENLLRRLARKPWEPSRYTFSEDLDADAEQQEPSTTEAPRPRPTPIEKPQPDAQDEAALRAQNAAMAQQVLANLKAVAAAQRI